MSKIRDGLTDRYPAQVCAAIVDMLAVSIGGVFAYYIRFGVASLHERYTLAIAVIALITIILNSLVGAYSRWRITRLSKLIYRLVLVWIAVGVIATSIIYFSDASARYSRLWVVASLVISLILSSSFRLCVQLVLRWARSKGKSRRPVFLVGVAPHLLHVAKGMRSYPGEGYSIAGIHRVAGTLDDQEIVRIVNRITASRSYEVWICLPLEMGKTVREIFYHLRNDTAEVRFIPSFKDMRLLNHRMSEVAGHYSIDLSVTPMSGMARVVKRMEDILLGGIISFMITPICLVIGIVVKATSPGPILFKQYRTGANGKKVKVYKFRSMVVHDEKDGLVTQAKKGDSRVTKVGEFLRRTSLDELPQFYNVLQGRMSIVGPRPHALAHNEYYKDIVESYMRRHKVKPGITGWAQVNGFRGETDTLDKMEKRVEYDLWYIDNWSLWLDIKIIFLTVFKSFVDKNAY